MAKLSRPVKTAFFVAAGIMLLVVVLFTGAALSKALPEDFLSSVTSIIMKVFSILMLIIFIVSIALLVFTFRKPKKVSVLSLIIAVCISLVSMVVYSVFIGYEPPFWLWLLMLPAGAAVGFFWARTTKLYIHKNQVMSKNSVWYLVVWGAVFAVNQLIAIVTNRPPDIAMALLIVSTATVWGTNGNIIWRYYKVLPGLQDRMIEPTAVKSQQKATPQQILVDQVDRKNLLESTNTNYCPKCKAILFKDAIFCMKCGEKL